MKSLSSVLIIKYRGGENERKFVEIHCGRVKNYLCERGTQLSNDSKGKKRRTFRFMPESCNNEADQKSLPPKNTKGCSRRNYKQVRANFQSKKFLLLGLIISHFSLILTTTALNSLHS